MSNVVIMANQVQVVGMGRLGARVADWISKYLFDNSVVEQINKSGKLALNSNGRVSAESWVYIDSVINGEALISKACNELGLDNQPGRGGIIFSFIPLNGS